MEWYCHSFYTSEDTISYAEGEEPMPVPPSQDRQVNDAWWRQFCNWIWKISGVIGTGVILSIVVSVFSTWLTSSSGNIPSDSPLAQLLIHWPIVLLVGCCLLLVAILARVLSQEPIHSTSSSLTKQNRNQMLQQLQRTYCQLARPPFQEIAWPELRLTSRPGAVENITNHLQHHYDQAEPTFPTSISIIQAYEQAARQLLILGEPGSGKSTLLYQLGSYLVEQAKLDETLPLPILLPLSSWAVKRPPLQEWIYEQLCSPLYAVPRQICRQWIKDEQIVPLLDGLDEMEESARKTCITAINMYNREHLMPLVVCSRQSEYTIAAKSQRLMLQNAVVVQPLTRTQIDAYFAKAEKSLAALRSALRKNPALRELATIPLMLNVLTLTYWGAPVRGLSRTAPLLQQQIWTNYIRHMVDQKKYAQYYSPEYIYPWLHWLALQMRTHHQSIFYLELLQPDWLPVSQRFFYRWTISLISVSLGLLSGMLLNLIIGGLLNGLAGGLIWGMAFIWLFGRSANIEPIGAVVWSPKGARMGSFIGLALGLTLKLIFGFVLRSFNAVTTFLITPAFVAFGIIAMGISGKQLVARDHLIFNEGIRRSAKIGLMKGLSIGLIIGLISGTEIGIIDGLALGLFCTLFWGLQSGLIVVVRHYVLRFWLWRARVFPWHAPRFLDDARAHVLLRPIGGGYCFTHNMLLDHFADTDRVLPLAQTPVQTSGASQK